MLNAQGYPLGIFFAPYVKANYKVNGLLGFSNFGLSQPTVCHRAKHCWEEQPRCYRQLDLPAKKSITTP